MVPMSRRIHVVFVYLFLKLYALRSESEPLPIFRHKKCQGSNSGYEQMSFLIDVTWYLKSYSSLK